MNTINETRSFEPNKPRSGDNLDVSWGEEPEEIEVEWEDHCKGSHCDSSRIDKM